MKVMCVGLTMLWVYMSRSALSGQLCMNDDCSVDITECNSLPTYLIL